MSKIRLKRLEITNFRSVDKLAFDFPEHGVVLLQGPSGSGKSTFILALSVILDCCPFPMTELQSWHSDTPFQVKATFHSEKHGDFTIARGAKNKLTVGDSKITSVKNIIEKTYELLGLGGMPRETVKDLTYGEQQDPDGDFLTWPNADKQAFLAALLGMNRFEVGVELAKENLAQMQVRRGHLETQRVGKQEYLKALDSQMATLPPIDIERETALKAHIETLTKRAEEIRDSATMAAREHSECRSSIDGVVNAQLADARRERDAAMKALMDEYADFRARHEPLKRSEPGEEETKLEKLHEAGTRKLADLQMADVSRRSLIDAHAGQVDQEIGQLQSQVSHKPEVETALAKLEEQLKQLMSRTCPTCLREWHEEGLMTFTARTERDIAETRTNLTAIYKAQTDLNEARVRRAEIKWVVDPEIEKLQAGLKKLMERIQQLRGIRTLDFAATKSKAELFARENRFKIDQVEMKLAGESNRLKNEMNAKAMVLERAWLSLDSSATTAAAEVAMAKTQYQGQVSANKQAAEGRASLESQIAAANQEIAETEQAAEALEREMGVEQDFIAAVGREGFMGSIFDEIIQEIAEETNVILGRVNNTSTVVLEFRSESETSKGTVTKSIKPYITISGHEAALKSGLSGGMQSAVKLANKLARRAVIGRRTSTALGWVCLDEPFDGMGRVDKETALEILNEIGSEDLVVVVDHGDSFKGQFSQTLKFELKNGVTKMDLT